MCSWLINVYQTTLGQATGFLNLLVAVHSIVPPRHKNTEHTHNSFRGKRPMIVPYCFTATAYQSEAFRALFRTLTPLQQPPPILLYIRGSLEYNSF